MVTTPDDREIFDCGTVVFETHSINNRFLDVWVGEIAAISQQRVAWFLVDGRTIVKTIGDVDRTKVAIWVLKNMHDVFFATCCSFFGRKMMGEEIDTTLSTIWSNSKQVYDL